MQEEIYKNLSLEDLPGEEWRDVVGYEGCYQCSSLGRIKSIRSNKILKQIVRTDGYLGITLCKDSNPKRYLSHRIISYSFIPNPNNYPIINHKNEVKTDNRVVNLEHCNYTYNNTYGSRECWQTKKLSPPVCKFSLDGELLDSYNSVIEASNCNKYLATNINRVCQGIRATAGGFIWRYKGDAFYMKERLNRTKVVQYSKSGDFMKEYNSIREASKECKISEDGIGNCCAGRSKSSGGYVWKYVNI